MRAPTGGKGAAGTFPLEECHLPRASINEVWPQLEFDDRPGIQRVAIRVGSDDEMLLTLSGNSPDLPELEVDGGISVTHEFAGDTVVIAGVGHIQLQVLGRNFRVSAASFFQVNTAMAGRMVEHVLERMPNPADLVLDVYCGVGLFSAFMASKCTQLTGIESSPAACEDYGVNLDEFDNVELYEATAAQVLPALKGRPDLVVLDPPRAGLEPTALEALQRLAPARIIYVSCDPSTLARDAAGLIGSGYQLAEVTPFDLFPQTFHIESISVFDK
jgi:23S rRNA (uracil1939-C5)-methyltransferase